MSLQQFLASDHLDLELIAHVRLNDHLSDSVLLLDLEKALMCVILLSYIVRMYVVRSSPVRSC